jgi:hypothetical protein
MEFVQKLKFLNNSIDEIKGASRSLQDKMLEKLFNFTVLSITDDAQFLADVYIQNGIFPEKYSDDALHTAITSTNQQPRGRATRYVVLIRYLYSGFIPL